MKKNSPKKDIQKPEVGEFYKLFRYRGLDYGNIIEILKIEGNIAFYRTLDGSSCVYNSYWDFISFNDVFDRKLTPLEVELL